MKMEKTANIKLIEEKYDEFFGTGYWEEQYKKQIVTFAVSCFSSISCLEAKPKALNSMQQTEKVCDVCGSSRISGESHLGVKCYDCSGE